MQSGESGTRFLVGFGAGKSAGAVVCEVFERGNPAPCIRIFTRDTGSMGTFGGKSGSMLNQIFNALAVRLAETLNTKVSLK